jgi:hypothetical protein
MKRSRRYYINLIPKLHRNLSDFTLDETFEDFKKYKKSVAEHFKSDMKLKEDYPDLYNSFMDEELSEAEIEAIKQAFYEEKVIVYSDKLSCDEYELE